MRVREFMTTNVITVTVKTSIDEARRLMVEQNIRRLPVVDRGKLIGMVSDKGIGQVLFSSLTTHGKGVESSLTATMKVGDLIKRDIVTITPDTTAESALAMAQELKIGALPVVDEGILVGIVTTNDFVYRILNPVLGLGKPGVRLHIYNAGTARKIEDVMRLINKHDLEIEAIHVDEFAEENAEENARDLIIQVNTTDPSKLIEDIKGQGYEVKIRER
ncbi:MAG: CBS domain-containing protein [Dehalococcoidia bacterium]|nr:CBS domain-containing protein [Dehalococcoidia bacterium]